MARDRAQPRRRGQGARARPRRRGSPVAALRPIGRPRLHLRETDSTNERAKELAVAGAPHGTLVTADAQTAGRGRQGRAWVAAPRSSVLASLVLRGPEERMMGLPLMAPVAVSEACERCVRVECAIKWPNDVWIEGGKVAGILLEGRPREGWAVLGIGINVTARREDLPADVRETATTLAAAAPAGHAPAIEEVLAALLDALAAWLDVAPHGIVSAWRDRDALRDRPIRWEGGQGTARGITPSGALVVETETQTTELHAGEVTLVRPVEGRSRSSSRAERSASG